jgi:hypothetical protein
MEACQPQQPPPRDRTPNWWQKPGPLWIIIAVLTVLATGAAITAGVIAASTSDDADRELADARDQIASERRALDDEKADLQDEIDALEQEASDARRAARREEKKLDRLRDRLSGAERQIEDNTVPGTGTYVVGEDIQPGTYRGEASPGCYWARLASLDTSDIIDNQNADGPVVIEVLPSDKALELSSCADLVRQGG